MAKHHPDLIMCRKQPGIGTAVLVLQYLSMLTAVAVFYLSLLSCSDWQAVREM